MKPPLSLVVNIIKTKIPNVMNSRILWVLKIEDDDNHTDSITAYCRVDCILIAY